MSYNPNRKPFPRAEFLKFYRGDNKVHPLAREMHFDYYRTKNPLGYHHDLGAQDIFLDNFGMLIAEQFAPSERRQYDNTIHFLLGRWGKIKHEVLQRKPYWGKNYNIKTRKANSGEPRNLIRFLRDGNLAEIQPDEFANWFPAEQNVIDDTGVLHNGLPSEPSLLLPDLWGAFRKIFGHDSLIERPPCPWENYDDWDPDLLFPDDWKGMVEQSERRLPLHKIQGVILPPDFPLFVKDLRLLHPKHATPDLPLRVGYEPKDIEIYKSIVRDQGILPACVAHAVSVGLDLLVRRQHPRKRGVQFSPAWLHCASGKDGEAGRSLSRVIEAIRHQLPCHETVFPYKEKIEEIRALKSWSPPWSTSAMDRSSRDLTNEFGPTHIRKIKDPGDIALIKAHLAAGWVVIVTTSITEDLYHGNGFNKFGLPLSTLIGQKHLGGHAWLLVGYDHVDGNSSWKYQGRFLTLNSWGDGWPEKPSGFQGSCTLPFGMLLTEGLEAYALRLPVNLRSGYNR